MKFWRESDQWCDAPNSAPGVMALGVMAPGVKLGCHIFFYIFFPIYYKLITFKLVHSYKVQHLTCTILCSSELQNIYKLHIWKCSTFTLLTKETKIHIHYTEWSFSGHLMMC